jgi:hypothetical protein
MLNGKLLRSAGFLGVSGICWIRKDRNQIRIKIPFKESERSSLKAALAVAICWRPYLSERVACHASLVDTGVHVSSNVETKSFSSVALKALQRLSGFSD